MTNTEITPELLREVADWIDGTGHGLSPGAALRDEANRIERANETIAEIPPRRISPLALTCYFQNPYRDTAWVPGTRTWHRQSDISDGVTRVLDRTGDVMRRIGDTQDWMPLFHNGEDMGTSYVHRVDNPGSDSFAPFTELRKVTGTEMGTEVIADA